MLNQDDAILLQIRKIKELIHCNKEIYSSLRALQYLNLADQFYRMVLLLEDERKRLTRLVKGGKNGVAKNS